MAIKYNRRLSGNARTLRRNMTKEERHLWYDFLRQLPMMVHRQKVIGEYIVDFYIAEAKLVVELDGSQHYNEAGICADTRRDAYLKSLGISVLRFANSDIWHNFSGVCEAILDFLDPTPGLAYTRPPSPEGEGL